MATKRRRTKRKKRPADEKAALIADVDRWLTRLGGKWVDEVRAVYDAAVADAGQALKSKQHVRDLQDRFVADASTAAEPVRALKAEVLEAIDVLERETFEATARAGARILRAVAEANLEATASRMEQQARLSNWLDRHGRTARRPADESRESYHRALQALAALRESHRPLDAWAASERALAEEWSEKVRLARAAGEEALAAEAEDRLRVHEAAAREMEQERALHAAECERLGKQLEEVGRRLRP